MPGRFLRTFEPVMRLIPEVKSPERRVSFNEKLFWTGMALILYLVMAEVPLYGMAAMGQDNLYIRVIFASNQGTLMELGIGPIVTAGLILQMLAGSGFIDVNFSDPEDRSLFTGASKIFSIVLTGFQASAYLVGGLFGNIQPTQSIIVFLQLLTAGVILMLLDEMIQKGWGIGSGISLFILAGVAQRIVSDCFSVIPVGGGDGDTWRYNGIISALIQAAVRGDPLNPLITNPSGYPDIIGLFTTMGVFLFVIYTQGIRVELPIAHARFRGFRGKYPISLLYVSNLPVIFASALFGNVVLWSQLLWNNYKDSDWAWLIAFLGKFDNVEGRSVPVDGLAYYVTAPTRGLSDVVASPL
ncbi:MAG: preprotein translocase subunit SecY, partial [Candidatus Bathyarchaeota archaeon]|nr:preprotein translocase subunit SecY [Candidatus Bathyarchaeota archaeon]